MSTTAYQLLYTAYVKSSLIPLQTQEVASYLTTIGLQYLNDIITEWSGDTSCIPYQSVVEFDFVAGQQDYTFGLDESYDVNVNPIEDVFAITYFINPPTSNIPYRVIPATEMEWSNLPYRGNSTYPKYYILRKYPHYSTISFQCLPNSAMPVTVVCKQRLQPVGLYDDLEVQFPPTFLLNLQYRVTQEICDANGIPVSDVTRQKWADAQKNMKGNNVINLDLVKPEMLRSGRISGYYGSWGVS